MGADNLKYFQTRSEPLLRKMLLTVKTIIQDIVVKMKIPIVYELLTYEVTDISNTCQLVSFVKYYDYNKAKVETVFIDCSNLLVFSANSSPNADFIVSCITKKFQELKMEISNLKAFFSHRASFIVGKKGGVATKLKTNFTLKMFNIHCICHRIALACVDTGDDYKFIRNAGEILIEL